MKTERRLVVSHGQEDAEERRDPAQRGRTVRDSKGDRSQPSNREERKGARHVYMPIILF